MKKIHNSHDVGTDKEILTIIEEETVYLMNSHDEEARAFTAQLIAFAHWLIECEEEERKIRDREFREFREEKHQAIIEEEKRKIRAIIEE